MSLLVEVKHKSNWANETVRRSRRSKFMCALVSALKAVPIYPPGGGVDVQGSAANPNYNVALSQGEVKEYADDASKGREDVRLVPKKKLDEAKERLSPAASKGTNSGAGMTQSESGIVDGLTSRDPASDPARDQAWTSSREDSSTLSERPSLDPSDIDEVRGLLRRESTRGKRKVSSDAYRPTVPSISEQVSQQPPQLQLQDYTTYPAYPAPASAGGYENQRPAYTTTTSPYAPQSRPTLSQYGAAPGQIASAVEMSQVQPPQRSPSNPYRQRQISDSINRKSLSPSDAEAQDENDDFGNMRPYSGV